MACDEQTLQKYINGGKGKFYARTLLRLCDKGRLKICISYATFYLRKEYIEDAD